jgi:hypothetical protein
MVDFLIEWCSHLDRLLIWGDRVLMVQRDHIGCAEHAIAAAAPNQGTAALPCDTPRFDFTDAGLGSRRTSAASWFPIPPNMPDDAESVPITAKKAIVSKSGPDRTPLAVGAGSRKAGVSCRRNVCFSGLTFAFRGLPQDVTHGLRSVP